MLWIILIAVLVAIGGVLALAASKADKFHIERTILIEEPAERIFPLLDDFRRWTAWSPWETMDPTMTRSYSGAASGLGAVYNWEGSGRSGAGRMEITQSAPPVKMSIQLDFTKPFTARNVTEFLLQSEGSATRVTWSMHGPNRFVGKLMGLFISPDRMVGTQFAKGLATLKTLSEQR